MELQDSMMHNKIKSLMYMTSSITKTMEDGFTKINLIENWFYIKKTIKLVINIFQVSL